MIIPKTTPLEYITLGKSLLNNLQQGKISMEEFDIEVAYMAMNCGFDELKPHPMPEKPSVLLDYENLDDKEKSQVGSSFWHQREVAQYIKQQSMIISENLGSKEWLKELVYRFGKIGDIVNRNKCKEALNVFTN